jgi:hypothetical protein
MTKVAIWGFRAKTTLLDSRIEALRCGGNVVLGTTRLTDAASEGWYLSGQS